MLVCQTFTMSDLVMLLHGQHQPLGRIQPQLSQFFTQNYLNGREPTDENITVSPTPQFFFFLISSTCLKVKMGRSSSSFFSITDQLLCFYPPGGSFQSRQRTGGIYQRELRKCFMSSPSVPNTAVINYRAVSDSRQKDLVSAVLIVLLVQHCFVSPQHVFT